MSEQTERRDSCGLADTHLRSRLESGVWAGGTLLNIVDIANRLKLSPTPVREVVCRLRGEGLLDFRHGQGYFVPDLSPSDVAELYRVAEALVLLALSQNAVVNDLKARDWPIMEGSSAVLNWIAGQGRNHTIERMMRQITGRLAPILSLEEEVLGCVDQMVPLHSLNCDSSSERSRMIRRYFSIRVRAAPALVSARRANGSQK